VSRSVLGRRVISLLGTALNRYDCPECDSTKGQDCWNSDGMALSTPHVNRLKVASRDRAVIHATVLNMASADITGDNLSGQ